MRSAGSARTSTGGAPSMVWSTSGRRPRFPVAKARIRSPDECSPAPPVRPTPRAARWARRSHWPGRSAASVATITMIDPPGPAPVPEAGSSPGSGPTGTPSTRRRSRRPWLAWTSTPTVQPSTIRDAVPIPPLKPWHCMPVPLPTPPSATRPAAADSSAALTCSGRTCIPLMSFRSPSYVSPTTGRYQRCSSGETVRAAAAMSASRTTPTECVFVSPMTVVRSPASRIHSRPVSSPFPFRRWQPANAGSAQGSPAPGKMTVTPVRTGPRPTESGPSPSMSVVWPTRTPATSVIALAGPGVRLPTTIPKSRARCPTVSMAAMLSIRRQAVRPPSWRARPSSGMGSQTAAVPTW
jgi:hypothetical protein